MDDRGKQKQQQQLHHQQEGQQENHVEYGVIQSDALNQTSIMDKEGGDYELGELDRALFLYLDGQGQSELQGQRQYAMVGRMKLYSHEKLMQACKNPCVHAETLNIFPSQPMYVDPTNKDVSSLATSTSDATKKAPVDKVELGNPRSNPPLVDGQCGKNVKTTSLKRERETQKKGTTSTSEREGHKTSDPKTLRRLAQNREAARKSRLRKKAYVQQLESSRIRLVQLEQELHTVKAQGLSYGGVALLGDQGLLPQVGMGGMSSEATMFDMEYGRWLEEHHKLMCELRAAMQEEEHIRVGDNNRLRAFVDGCLAHYDEMVSIKNATIKTDVFHLLSGTWVTPAERCFLWIGGFRPSHLIKIEASTEQQLLGIYGLQHSAHETEEALTQGLDALNRSLSDTIASGELNSPSNVANYMAHMAIAVNKLSTLEDFVRQADSLRQQTLHRLHHILTTRQAARCYLAVAEFFHRLRALSSIWLTRPRQEQ